MYLRRLLARAALRVPLVERGLRAACAAGLPGAYSVAHAYTDVLEEPCLRRAPFEGYTLLVNVAEYRGVASHFRGERGIFWFVPALVRPGDVCVDVGANMGHYTLALAHQAGPTGRVVAFEPQPYFADLLVRSVRDNGFEGRVAIDERATYRVSGETVSLYLGDSKNSGLASLHGTFTAGPRAGRPRGESQVAVETVTLDDAFAAHRVERCRLLKIDVEEAEVDVLLGARDILAARRADLVLLETRAGSPAHRILLDAGYRGFRADEQRRRLLPLAEVPDDQFGDDLFVSPAIPDAAISPLAGSC